MTVLSVTDKEGVAWTTTPAALADPLNHRLGLVVCSAVIDGVDTVTNASLSAWERGEFKYGCDFSHREAS